MAIFSDGNHHALTPYFQNHPLDLETQRYGLCFVNEVVTDASRSHDIHSLV